VTHTYYRGININLERQGYRELFDMTIEPGENYSVAESHPDVANDLSSRIASARERFAPFKRGIPPFIQELMRQGQHRQQD
jgi:uncharacterized sulfatase